MVSSIGYAESLPAVFSRNNAKTLQKENEMKIAVVDDDVGITGLMKHVIARYDDTTEVVEYNSTTKFNLDIELGNIKYDFVIMDLNFYDDVPGFVSIEKINKFNPECRIAVLSSNINEDEERKKEIDKVKLNVFRVYEKPMLPSAVIELIRSFA